MHHCHQVWMSPNISQLHVGPQKSSLDVFAHHCTAKSAGHPRYKERVRFNRTLCLRSRRWDNSCVRGRNFQRAFAAPLTVCSFLRSPLMPARLTHTCTYWSMYSRTSISQVIDQKRKLVQKVAILNTRRRRHKCLQNCAVEIDLLTTTEEEMDLFKITDSALL